MSVNLAKVGILAMAALLFTTGNASAGCGARNISSQSAQAYLSGGGRYAETEDADTVLNNPAGAAYMDDGQHFHLSAMISPSVVELTDVDTGKVYEQKALGLIPDFAATYKKNNWAGFFTLSFPGGNGGGSFDRFPGFDYAAEQASAALGQTITAENQEFDFAGGKGALSMGGAWAINDMFSLGYAIRAVYAMNFREGETTLIIQNIGQELASVKMDQTWGGWGVGHSLCMLFKHDKFKLGLRYDPRVSIKIKADVKQGDNSGTVNGAEMHDDLPAAFFSGWSYQLTPALKIGGGFLYFWQKGINGSDEPLTDKWDNGYEIQGFVEYQLTPEWELIGGILYNEIGVPDEGYSLATTSFYDNWTINMGTQWRPIPRWSFILGLGYTHHTGDPKTNGEPMGVYERSVGQEVIQYFVGLEYKM